MSDNSGCATAGGRKCSTCAKFPFVCAGVEGGVVFASGYPMPTNPCWINPMWNSTPIYRCRKCRRLTRRTGVKEHCIQSPRVSFITEVSGKAICPKCKQEKNGWLFGELNGQMVCQDCRTPQSGADELPMPKHGGM